MSDDPRAAVPSAARRMLRPAHLKAIERTEEQLRALDDACRLLVQDARDMKEPLTSCVGANGRGSLSRLACACARVHPCVRAC